MSNPDLDHNTMRLDLGSDNKKDLDNQIQTLRNEMCQELTDSILPYWMEKVSDTDRGGYHGRIDGKNAIDLNSERSAILNTRILWTFSSAYRIVQKPEYFPHIQRAYDYLVEHFMDEDNGGVYWSVNANGNPLDTRKHTYAQGFAIYAFAETYRSTGNLKARDHAIDIFKLLENHAFDADLNAYYEAFDVVWNRLEDVRLSSLDLDAHRSTNTHLHLLEAFSTLYKAWPDAVVKNRIELLLGQFMGPIFNNKNKHFYAFFDKEWNSVSQTYSFGHDIETVWLMLDAARAIQNEKIANKIELQLLDVARVILAEGIDPVHRGLFYTGENGRIVNPEKHWWPQAEAILGFYYAYEISRDVQYLNIVLELWEFINDKIIDHENGEWFFKLNRDGEPFLNEDKVGFWKCPYHSARACLEIMERSQSQFSI